MKKRIIYVVLYSFVLALVLAAETIAIWSVLRLGMVPDLYIGILAGVFALFLVAMGLLLFVHRKGKWIGVARQIIACLLAALVVAGCFYVTPKLNKLQTTVEQITTTVPIGPTRNIYVKIDDPAQTIQDTTGYTFAAFVQDEYCTEQVVETLEKELQTSITVQSFDNESLMITAYYNQEVDALILNEGYLSVWAENELYDSFDEKNRAIYSVPVTENQQTEQTEPETEPVEDITNTPFVLYISGKDGYSEKLTASRSDVNILMVVNPSTKQILMINTPRDYYVVHPWGRGGRDKLTHFGVYGVDCSIDALEALYDTTVNYYLQINFTGFEKLVDAVGGITVHSDHAFTCGEETSVYIIAGENKLDGYQALSFARDRYHQASGDNGRGQNQMKVIKAVIGKVTSGRTLIANYSSILSSLEGMLATSIPAEDINKLVKMQLTDMAQWSVLSYAVTGYGGTATTYSMPGTAAYVMYPNQKTVEYGQQLIQRVLDGETLTQDDMTVPES